MLQMKRLLATVFLLGTLAAALYANTGYQIKIKVPGLKDSTVTLAHYFANEKMTFIKDDSAKLNKKGEAVFANEKPLAGGMYIVILPGRKYFDLLIGDNQHFDLEADTADLIRKVTFTNSKENELFYGYRRLITDRAVRMKALNDEFAHATQTQKDSINKLRNNLNTEVKSYIRKSMDEHQGTFFATWLKGLQEIEIPPYPRDAKGNVIDSTFQYKYWHNHFFDNFDIANVRLLHTPFYERKVLDYLDKAAFQIPDSIKKETDLLMAKAGNNEEVRRYMLGTLYNHLAEKANQIVGMDGAFVYFAEKYYLPEATWAEATFKENLKKDIAKIKPNLIGNPAPPLPLADIPVEHFLVSKTDTVARKNMQIGRMINLQDIKAKFTVLVFWEVDCGHCQKEIPILYDSIRPLLQGKDVKIVAVHMLTGIDAKAKWVDFVNNHKLYDWINATPLDYAYKETYNIVGTPTIYILDEDKHIIYKRISYKKIPDIINFELKKKQKS